MSTKSTIVYGYCKDFSIHVYHCLLNGYCIDINYEVWNTTLRITKEQAEELEKSIHER